MSRSHHVPSYRRHKQSRQAIVTLTDGFGGRRDILLGKYGTAASRAEYARVLAEWEANGRRLPKPTAAADLTVTELIRAFWCHAEQHYRHPDGRPTDEIACLRAALRPLRELYGHTAAKDFGPLALKAVRQKMIESVDLRTGRPWCRGNINLHTYRIRHVFKWGVENELIPPAVLIGLQAVRGLQKGRCAARESEPVKPVPEAFVTLVLPHVSAPVRAMIELQLLTGMRPGEVIIIRGIDIDMTGKVWLYRPGSDQGPEGAHKTAWRGHGKVIAIGPRAQEIIKEFLKPNVEAYLFSPADAMEVFIAKRRKERKTRVQPSRADPRRKAKPNRTWGAHYSVDSYRRAIGRGILFANTARACDPCKELDQEERCAACKAAAVPHWHPHQLRHTKATEIRREAGLDAARAVLGHRSPSITEVYAEIDIGKAAEIMERLG
jgi:integrase